jgi:hypothetical protein
MVQRRMARFGSICSARRPFSGRSTFWESPWHLVAFLEGGNPFRQIVLLDGEVFRSKVRDVVSFAISDGNIELHKNDVHVKTRCLVLCRGPYYAAQREKKTKEYFEACESSV